MGFRVGLFFLFGVVALSLRAQEKPPIVRTTITIVEKIEAETPGSISVLDNRQLRETPGVDVDDRLRNIPGFSLFRRSSSLASHPTTQGISLRGIGSSGASRSLVLLDGVPVTDPFGGWVYWTRFAPDELERVEVSRGASTSVFGDRAMGGVVAMFSREPAPRRLYGRYEGGSRNTHDAGAGYSHVFSRWALGGQARAYTTDGFFIIPADRRGAVDTQAGVRFVSAAARADWLSSAHRFFLKSDILAEDRQNGTVLQTNSTGLGQASLHYRGEWAGQTVSLLGYHAREEFRSAFSSILANRSRETLTYRQTVPAEATGAAGLWGRSWGVFNLLAGADAVRTEGYSTDRLVPTGVRIGGGSLVQHGYFAQADGRLGPARFFLGARENATGQGRTFFSPNAGAVLGGGRWRARGSVYRSFRAPTLNELYREFRAGNAVTQANADLRPETLFGAEAGVDFTGESYGLRATFYRNDIKDLITNVTLQSTPSLIVRQRQNAASALSRGAEVNASLRRGNFRGELGYLLADSRFSTRERVPQIPRHQGTGQLTFEKNRTMVSAGVRSFAAQFEDERNVFVLPGFATVQVMARHRLTAKLSAIGALENALNREFLTGFSPVPTIGNPRLWRIGLRWEGRL